PARLRPLLPAGILAARRAVSHIGAAAPRVLPPVHRAPRRRLRRAARHGSRALSPDRLLRAEGDAGAALALLVPRRPALRVRGGDRILWGVATSAFQI